MKLLDMPRLGKWATPLEQVAHAIPGQECWTSEKLIHLSLVQAKGQVHLTHKDKTIYNLKEWSAKCILTYSEVIKPYDGITGPL